MSDKRFYITDTGLGLDTVSDEMYSFCDEEDFCRLFDKLNEQQVIITELNDELETKCHKLEKENEELKQKVDFYKYFQKDARELEKENIELRQKLDFYLLDEFEWKEKYGDCDE